ncbi:MAG TPA: hypothetical protein VFT08_08540 [Pyrinomonadaceae bacterium]|nr:hypothetical protein [Pyrinomonadaceae bacterium]
MKNKTRLLSAVVLLAVCMATLAQRENIREAKPNEVPFTYNTSDYGKVEIESVPKSVFQEGDIPTEAPAHSCYHLEDKRPLPALDQGARYFYPAYSTVCIIPLTDTSVRDYAKSYPYIHEAAIKLRKLLAKRPARFRANKDINDVPFNNASAAIQSKVQYLSFKTGAGILFLTQYSQDTAPSPVNNEELTCNFQGLSTDGKYYVAARLAITHPSLPKGIDFTNIPTREADKNQTYLRKDEQLLNSFTDESFRPSLKSLKALIASITTNGN